MSNLRSQPVTIALVSSYPLHVGGVETHLLSLVRHCPPGQFRWLLIGPISPEFQKRMAALGVEIVAWQPRNLLDRKAIQQLVQLLQKQHVNVVHFHCPRAAFMVRPFLRKPQIPTVVTVQLPPYYFKTSKYINSFLRRQLYFLLESILNRYYTDKLIYASLQVMDEAHRLRLIDPRKTIFLGNGVDLAYYQNTSQRKRLRQEFAIADDEKLLCSVCRLDEQKGIDVLLKAFAHLNPRSLRAKLLVVGDGELRPQLQAQIEALGLRDYVTLPGFRNDIQQILSAADAFVLASRYEAMPLSIIEAMASGLPCVVTDTGETAQIVENGVSGLVVPKEDAGMLARALEIMLSYDEQRVAMGKAARERSQQYSDIETARRVHLIYLQLIK